MTAALPKPAHFATSRRDARLLAIALLVLTVVHVASWPTYPPDVDPLAFRAALQSYDVSAGRPHPPGYPLFIALGRLMSQLVGVAHALPAVNWALVTMAAFGLYGGLAARGEPRVGVAAALLLVCHPLVWSATLASESYMADAAFPSLIFGLTGWLRDRPRALWPALALALLALGLFRAVSLLLFSPFTLACLYASVDGRAMQLRRVAWGALLCAVTVGMAYATTVFAAGGPAAYRAAVESVMVPSFRGASVLGGAPWRVHVSMITKLVGWCVVLSAPVWLLWITSRWRSVGRFTSGPVSAWILWLWFAPAFLFYAIVYYLKPTYQLAYLPAFCVAASLMLARTTWSGTWKTAAVALTCTAGLTLTLLGTARLPLPLYRLTNAYLREQDAASTDLVRFLARLDPQRTLVVWVDHPQLTVYALRLGDWRLRAATYARDTSRLQKLDVASMSWRAPEGPLPVQGITTLAMILNDGGRPSLRTLDVDATTLDDAAVLAALTRR
jgi:hypothetical protein